MRPASGTQVEETRTSPHLRKKQDLSGEACWASERLADDLLQYFCTDSSAEVRDILEAVAARWAIEEQFHDVKEVWGAGQQQVRNIWSNIGCWNLNGWLYTLVELCCWEINKSEITDRRDRPWDNADRRPSHADRRRSIAREMLHKQFSTALPNTPHNHKLRTLFKDLIALAA